MKDAHKSPEIDFSQLRYACCWEDARTLLSALTMPEGGTIASIASGGDNTLYLLLLKPKHVLAFDLSAPQLHLLALKIAAFQVLSYPELIAFLGYRKHPDRSTVYTSIRPLLPANAALYWDAKQEEIVDGIIFCGRFEKYLRLFGRYVRPFIHGDATTLALLAPKDAEAQARFFQENWANWRWKLLTKAFFGKWWMGKKGRDPAMLHEIASTGTAILGRAEAHFASKACQESYFLPFMLGLPALPLPPYLQLEHFETIKAHLHTIQLVHGGLDTLAKSGAKVDAWNLSNIFEYMPEADFMTACQQIGPMLNPNGKVAYWNLFKNRNMATHLPTLNTQPIARGDDAGFFYAHFFAQELPC